MLYPGRASRFRLRFLLQEFELSSDDTFIGRSHDCQITIFDPLISRRHARIRVVGDAAVLEDLGSRNGIRVNGSVIRGPHTLGVGDRIRIGKHELVFGEVSPQTPVPRERQTGSLVFCVSCDTVYSGELGMCPSCGSSKAVDEETRSGAFDEEGKESWAVDMLLELFQKALKSNRSEEAERVMRQVVSALEAQLESGSRLDAARLEPVATAAIQLSELQRNGHWRQWAADLHMRAGACVPPGLAAKSESVANANGQK